MTRMQAWGRVERTKTAAIEDATDAFGRLVAETRRTQIGWLRYDEVRPTPTGFQARVSARTRPRRER